jgi:ABC-type transport system substrate-binding protein
MRTKVLWLFAAALVVTSLVVGPAASAKPSRSAAGTVVIGHDQEPATLNNLITPGNAYTTSLVTNLVLGSGEIYNQNATLVPQLFTGRAKLVKSKPLTVRFTIKPTAKWSDGRQVTGNDWKATYNAIMNKNWDHVPRGLGGHLQGCGEGQDRHGHVPEAVRRVGASRRDEHLPGAQDRRRELQHPLPERY